MNLKRIINYNMIDLFGWFGSLLLAVCGLPQAIKSIKDKHSDGVSIIFLLMWFFGEIFQLIYCLDKMVLPIILNCLMNFIFVSIIFYFKIFPRKS